MKTKYKSLLVTGGTGSFGRAFVRRILEKHPEISRLVIFSRDELKQFEMAQEFPEEIYPNIRFFLGDIRDKDRLKFALEGIDLVIHAAALKQVPAAEYNPFEFIKTNVLGAQNLLEACLETGVKAVVALSTDKAAAPINLYGATKLCSDKLFVSANALVGARDLKFSVVRYGNVMGSRGSVIPFFLSRRFDTSMPVTDERMTRFNISLDEGVDMVLWAAQNMGGGEIFVPKIPSYRILDLVKAINPAATVDLVGIRPGEKLHEEMITSSDSPNTVDLGSYYAILPPSSQAALDDYLAEQNRSRVPFGFNYSSGENEKFLTVDEIRDLIRANINPEFNV
jgi:UDP-N-acetylglucosamine 4,6-dehydratase (inverting)